MSYRDECAEKLDEARKHQDCHPDADLGEAIEALDEAIDDYDDPDSGVCDPDINDAELAVLSAYRVAIQRLEPRHKITVEIGDFQYRSEIDYYGNVEICRYDDVVASAKWDRDEEKLTEIEYTSGVLDDDVESEISEAIADGLRYA